MLCINNSSNHLEGSEEVTEVLESDGGKNPKLLVSGNSINRGGRGHEVP